MGVESAGEENQHWQPTALKLMMIRQRFARHWGSLTLHPMVLIIRSRTFICFCGDDALFASSLMGRPRIPTQVLPEESKKEKGVTLLYPHRRPLRSGS